MYIATESLREIDVKIMSEATVQEYCRTPRTLAEIAQHFDVETYIIKNSFLAKMLKSGEIRKSNELYPKAQLKYFQPETPVDVLSLANLQEFCKIHRATTEITQHFGIGSNMSVSHYLQPLIRAGKLFATRPQGSHDRKFTSIPPTMHE
jgi:hypothetical protein